MNDTGTSADVVEQLQQFGLKTYEAQCFVALSRVPQATAREISEISDVPRTRVYDAVEVLETNGLVTVQHTNPQVFRAVEISEAVDTLRRTYESRLRSVEESLETIDPITLEETTDVETEVWSLSGAEAITTRIERLLSAADSEVRLLAATGVDDSVAGELAAAADRGVTTAAGVIDDDGLSTPDVPAVDSLGIDVSPVDELGFPPVALPSAEAVLSSLLLVDGRRALVRTTPTPTGDNERAICAAGETNGVVVFVHHLLTPINR
ncbi:TrmB family transcriptional regulator [Halohasta salina]|uniref:TrmB family transcriptional regulator n=1 Tax=Halohasta salina TaxID=2961621 RepID=UPI0020A34855|nr:helix-turn-helix domain-containing protein [Halohasta salina]